MFQEIEKIPELRARLEEAASMELQNGWARKEHKEKEEEGERKSDSSHTQIVGAGGVSEGGGRGDGRAMEEGRRVSGGSGGSVGGAAVTVRQGRASVEPRSSLHSPSMERSSMSLADREGGVADQDVLLARRFGSVKR